MVEAEAGEVGREARLGCGDAKVGHQREAEAAADGRSLDRGHDGGPGAEEAHGRVVEVPRRALRARCLRRRAEPRARLRRTTELCARAEALALGAEHDGAAAGLLVERLEGGGEVVDQRQIEEVVGRASDLGRGDEVVADLHADVSEVLRVAHSRGFLLLALPLGRCGPGEPTSAGWRNAR